MYLFALVFHHRYIPRSGLLDHMIVIFAVFKGAFILFCTVAIATYVF